MIVRSIKGSTDVNVKLSLDEFKLLMKIIPTVYENFNSLSKETKDILFKMIIASQHQMEKYNYKGFTEVLK